MTDRKYLELVLVNQRMDVNLLGGMEGIPEAF